ncbi:pyridoxal-phosphate dependent enzyme [Acetobacterium wieringae]|uniref:L-cysteate sulfo-lyase n=1 Tax=Acetobacterium wieringae TaxID=52694 RepID=A0A1F2PHV8_9FIRM|nr:pyridoxal-phosphate dependent enzyme [Acetobacterium wieringae]OFV70917.1 L-cysteate sulfo-lyase [Acetobacterium wieringae]
MSTKNIFEKIHGIPKRHYMTCPTPIQKCENLTKVLGGDVEIYIKRDDILPFGGNKLRKLEFLFHEAVVSGADTIITGSTFQCNHNLMALHLANIERMKTALIMEYWSDHTYQYEQDRNKHLYELSGVEKIEVSMEPIKGPIGDMILTQEMKAGLIATGKKPYILARGGTSPLGNCGYVLCAEEIMNQGKAKDVMFDTLVCPSGTGGTQMGLFIGFDAADYPIEIHGINVFQNKEAQLTTLFGALDQTTSFLGVEGPDKKRVICHDGYYGDAYAQPTEALKEAIELLSRTEGIMLDPIYSGKTMAGLIDLIRSGEIKKGTRVLFLHTGGLNTYYDYSSVIDYGFHNEMK